MSTGELASVGASRYYHAVFPTLLLILAGQLHRGDTLEAVRFQGTKAFSPRVLASVVSSRSGRPASEAQLNSDAAAIETFYKNEGFHAVEIERQVTRGQRRPVVTFHVNEGPRTRVSAISLSGNVTVRTERLLRRLTARAGRFFSQSALDQSVSALRAFYLNSGYPFARVQANTTRRDTLATLLFDITEGRLCHIKEVRVRGNRTARTGIILRASEIRPGERFSQRRMQEAQRRLYATKLFYRVMFYVLADSAPERNEEPGTTDSVVVRFDVIEQAYRGVALGAGVETPPNRLLVSAEWEHCNLLGRGHTLVLGGEFSPTFMRNHYRLGFDAKYRVPYLVLTRIDFQTHPYVTYERLDTIRQREYGVETGMTRNVLTQLTLGLTNRLRLVSDTSSGVTNSLGLTGHYDTRDDIFDPRQGLSVQAVVAGAGGPLLGDNDFYRFTADVRWYQRLGRFGADADLVAAVRAMVGNVRPYGRTSAVPYYEAFTLGGRSSLRGYLDRSLGPDSSTVAEYRYGPAVANGNLELRTPYLWRWVGLVGFADLGGVSRSLRRLEYEYSAGAGIRVKTPIGPVRLDWGKRLRNARPADKGRFYLGLLHAF